MLRVPREDYDNMMEMKKTIWLMAMGVPQEIAEASEEFSLKSWVITFRGDKEVAKQARNFFVDWARQNYLPVEKRGSASVFLPIGPSLLQEIWHRTWTAVQRSFLKPV